MAGALVTTPPLLVLAEPANGPDPAGIVEVRRLIRSFAEEGMRVFVSSHLLGEVDRICDHLLMIQNGKLAFQGPVEELYATQTAELLARAERPEQAAALVTLVEQAGHTARLADDEPPGTVAVAADASWAPHLHRLAAAARITRHHLSQRPRRLQV